MASGLLGRIVAGLTGVPFVYWMSFPIVEGFEVSLIRQKRAAAPTPKLLDGAAGAKLIAMRLGKPPAGFGHWTLRLLADQMAELEIVESISPETVRQTLKKTA